jgi:hypothetical protein
VLRQAVQEGRAHVTGDAVAETHLEESLWDFLTDFGNIVESGSLDPIQALIHDLLHLDIGSNLGDDF